MAATRQDTTLAKERKIISRIFSSLMLWLFATLVLSPSVLRCWLTEPVSSDNLSHLGGVEAVHVEQHRTQPLFVWQPAAQPSGPIPARGRWT